MKFEPTKPDEAYFNRNPDVLGAMAWHGYLRHGRGAVAVQNAGDSKEQMVFLPLKMLMNPLCETLADLARDYNPLKESVVVFIRPSFAITAYKGALPGRETPPESYERMVRVLFGRPYRKGNI